MNYPDRCPTLGGTQHIPCVLRICSTCCTQYMDRKKHFSGWSIQLPQLVKPSSYCLIRVSANIR